MIEHHDHDDFGGLHRDLVSTGASMDRRQLLRIAASLGAGFGAMQLFGCSNAADITDPTNTGNGTCSRIPTETAGPLSR